MSMADFIVAIIVAAVIGYASYFIWKEKKKGNKCIGCSSNCLSCGGCPSGKTSSNYDAETSSIENNIMKKDKV